MKMMKKIITTMLVAMGLLGCQTGRIQLVWDKPARPTVEVKGPDGFAISPAEACEAVRKKPWALSLKHVWHIYADEHNYYVMDAFFGSSPRRAIRTGVIVDGHTGQIIERSSNPASQDTSLRADPDR